MKKAKWIINGLVAVLGLVLFFGRTGTPDTAELDAEVSGREDVPGAVVMAPTESSAPTVQLPVPENVPVESPRISDAVLTLVNPDSNYQTRLDSMRKFGSEMSPQDIEVLKNFLSTAMPENAKLSPLSYNSVRNDAFEILLRQSQLPEGLGELLTNVYEDTTHDDMWRNYCIQFMEPFYERAAKDIGGSDSVPTTGDDTEVVPPNNALIQIQNTLWNALGERDNSNAGTALLALDKLSRNHSEFNREDIDAATINLAQDEKASLANRVTALRLCGEHQNVQALETARNLAKHGDTTMLRCAAIATLGDLGTEEDHDLLEALAASRDERIRQVAGATLAKLGL